MKDAGTRGDAMRADATKAVVMTVVEMNGVTSGVTNAVRTTGRRGVVRNRDVQSRRSHQRRHQSPLHPHRRTRRQRLPQPLTPTAPSLPSIRQLAQRRPKDQDSAAAADGGVAAVAVAVQQPRS